MREAVDPAKLVGRHHRDPDPEPAGVPDEHLPQPRGWTQRQPHLPRRRDRDADQPLRRSDLALRRSTSRGMCSTSTATPATRSSSTSCAGTRVRPATTASRSPRRSASRRSSRRPSATGSDSRSGSSGCWPTPRLADGQADADRRADAHHTTSCRRSSRAVCAASSTCSGSSEMLEGEIEQPDRTPDHRQGARPAIARDAERGGLPPPAGPRRSTGDKGPDASSSSATRGVTSSTKSTSPADGYVLSYPHHGNQAAASGDVVRFVAPPHATIQ